VPELRLSLQQPDPRHRELLQRSTVRRWVRGALEGSAEIALRVVDAREGLALNRDFRGKAYATNVLTFDYAREPRVVADIVLCAEVIEHEARDERKPLADHYAHMVVHGVLHAQGFDHERAADARRMRSREIEILAALGVPDPYRPRCAGAAAAVPKTYSRLDR
jgi:probable rRNA maturation factor